MNTPNLNLFERDPNAEGGAFFSVQEMLNDNWNILDREFGLLAGRVHTAETELALPGVLLYSGSYTGTGGDTQRTISTTKRPWVVLIFTTDAESGVICTRPATRASRAWDGTYRTDADSVGVTWGTAGLTISANVRLNAQGKTYNWIALCTG